MRPREHQNRIFIYIFSGDDLSSLFAPAGTGSTADVRNSLKIILFNPSANEKGAMNSVSLSFLPEMQVFAQNFLILIELIG
jgi:hypothetical protein